MLRPVLIKLVEIVVLQLLMRVIGGGEGWKKNRVRKATEKCLKINSVASILNDF